MQSNRICEWESHRCGLIFLHILCECSETGKASVFRYVFPNWLPVSIIFAEKGNRSCKAEPVFWWFCRNPNKFPVQYLHYPTDMVQYHWSVFTENMRKEERRYMKKERQNTDQEALFEAILTLRSPEECYAFFKDLCTYQELNAMAQRLQVAKMLHEGHVFHEIVEETGASTATISRVNRAIKDGCDGYQIIFDRTEKTEEK